MVAYGHSATIGSYDGYERDMRRQIEAVLHEALDACRELLAPRKADIEAVARLLYDEGTCPGDTIHALLDELMEARA